MGNYKYYNYENLSIVSNRKPFNTHLWWEHATYGLILVDSVNQEKLYISTDKCKSWSEIDLSDNANSYKIQAGWLDGNDLWLVMCDNDGTADNFEVCYVELDDSNDCNPIDVSTGATAGTVYVGDIFIIGANVYVVDIEYRAGTRYHVAWIVDTSPLTVDLQTSFPDGGAGTEFGYGMVADYSGNDTFYFTFDSPNDNRIYFFWYEPGTGLVGGASGGLDAYRMVTSQNMRGLIRITSANFYCVLKKISDSKNYLVELTNGRPGVTATTELGKRSISIMLNRNVPSGVLQKGFHVSEYKVFELNSNSLSLFNYISHVLSDAIIIGITDNFLMNDDGDMFEYKDVISLILDGRLYHSRNDYPYLEMKFNSDNIIIDPQMFVQIIGLYTANDSNRIFEGTYNFKDDTIGSPPSGWTNNVAAVIYDAWQAHSHVLQLTRDGSNPEIEQLFGSDIEKGTIEFYMGADDVTSHSTFRLYDSATVVILISFKDGKITYYDSGYVNITDAAINTLYRIRIDFECGASGYEGLAADTFYIYINETRYGPYPFENAVPHIDKLFLTCNTAAVYHFYTDAFGYSWNSDYNINDNKYVEEGESNRVVFEGIAKKPTKGRVQFVLIENQSSEMDQVQPRGSKSGRTDEIIVDINNDGAPNGPEYIRDGVLSVGSAMGNLELEGAKDYREVVNDFAEHDAFLWNLRPQGALDYNNGSINSGATLRFDGSTYTDIILQLKSWTIAKLNQIIVNGAINTATGNLYTGKWDDEDDQLNNGINSVTIEDAQLNSDALCQTKADAMGGNESERTRTRFKFRKVSLGFIQPGQTITFKYDITNYITINEAQFIVDKMIMNIKSEIGFIEISSSL